MQDKFKLLPSKETNVNYLSQTKMHMRNWLPNHFRFPFPPAPT